MAEEQQVQENAVQVVESKELDTIKNPKKGLGKPVLIGLIAGVLAVVIVAAVFVYMNLPSTIYRKAYKQMLNEEYAQAIEGFHEIMDYSDAADLCQEAYLGEAKKQAKEGNYEKALELLEKVKNQESCEEAYAIVGAQMIAEEKYADAVAILEKSNTEDALKYKKYANAVISLNGGDFDAAISSLTELADFEKSAEFLNVAYYQKAEKLFAEKKYESAKTAYNNTTGYDDVAEKVQNCDLLLAEEAYKDGRLKDAKNLFSKLPSSLSYGGVSVSDRLATLEKHADKVALCGTWRGTGGKMTVRQTHDSTGLWDQWEGTYTESITIKVVINNDGSFTFKGNAGYYIYTNYSSLSKYLKTSNLSESFSVTGTSLPKTLESNSLVKMTYEKGKIKLSFDLKDKNSSVNFTYRYKSSISYTIG